MPRIALSGPSGTGKTTLATRLSERLEIPLCPVGARSVASEMGFGSPYDVDKAGLRREFIRVLTAKKASWEALHSDFVTDRSHYDNLVYTLMEDPRGLDKTLVEAARLAASRYTHLIVCPAEAFQKLGNDPARKTEAPYHVTYQNHLYAILERMNTAPRLTLASDDLDTRARAAEAFLKPA